MVNDRFVVVSDANRRCRASGAHQLEDSADRARGRYFGHHAVKTRLRPGLHTCGQGSCVRRCGPEWLVGRAPKRSSTDALATASESVTESYSSRSWTRGPF